MDEEKDFLNEKSIESSFQEDENELVFEIVPLQLKKLKSCEHAEVIYYTMRKYFEEQSIPAKIFFVKLNKMQDEATNDIYNEILKTNLKEEEGFHCYKNIGFLEEIIQKRGIILGSKISEESKSFLNDIKVKQITENENKNKLTIDAIECFLKDFEIIWKGINKKTSVPIYNNRKFLFNLGRFILHKNNLNDNSITKFEEIKDIIEEEKNPIIRYFSNDLIQSAPEFTNIKKSKVFVKSMVLINREKVKILDNLRIKNKKNTRLEPFFLNYDCVYEENENGDKERKLKEPTEDQTINKFRLENCKILNVTDFFFGEFIQKHEDKFFHYFRYNDLIEKMKKRSEDNKYYEEDLELYLTIEEGCKKNIKKKKKIEMIIKLFTGFELKIQFSYKNCSKVILENLGKNTVALYFQMIFPPKFFLNLLNKNKYENPFLKQNWTRVHNFFLNSFLDELELDEFLRIHLINNSTIKVN